MYEIVKTLHLSCALLSVSGFGLRGYWLIRRDPRLQARLTRVLPHLVDTVLLVTAVTLLVLQRLSPVGAPWLAAKLLALLIYILLGMVALRFGRTYRVRVAAFWLAWCTALYILSVAYTRSPLGAFSQ